MMHPGLSCRPGSHRLQKLVVAHSPALHLRAETDLRMIWILLAVVIVLILLQAGRENADVQRSPSSRGDISADPVEGTTDRPTAADWAEAQKAEYPRDPTATASEMRSARSGAAQEILCINSPLLNALQEGGEPVSLKVVWGTSRGWLSRKRLHTWMRMCAEDGNEVDQASGGALVRLYMDASSTIPHPYIPPAWAIKGLKHQNPEAYELARRWEHENAKAITAWVRARVGHLGVYSVSRHLRRNSFAVDYIDVAFILLPEQRHLLEFATRWKGEADLAATVASLFSDTIREYSPEWLGSQRLDIYIPSLNVAIEYNGEQHYRPVEFFGGKTALRDRQKLDRRKAGMCEKHGVTLIEWPHSKRVSFQGLEEEFRSRGIAWPDRGESVSSERALELPPRWVSSPKQSERKESRIRWNRESVLAGLQKYYAEHGELPSRKGAKQKIEYMPSDPRVSLRALVASGWHEAMASVALELNLRESRYHPGNI
jgi:hypothetical protein